MRLAYLRMLDRVIRALQLHRDRHEIEHDFRRVPDNYAPHMCQRCGLMHSRWSGEPCRPTRADRVASD